MWPVLWSSLVLICFLQSLPEAAGHNGETKAHVDHFPIACCKSSCLFLGSGNV